MSGVTTVFWDIGGVILTNGWDRTARKQAAAQFHLDWEDFQDRHDLAFPAFETGQTTIGQYLERTIFYRPRPFTQEEFKAYMFAQSQPYPESLAVLNKVRRAGRYLLATINNEPLEINEARIKQFNLHEVFTAFFSSCYLGFRKPDAAIYRIALAVTQRAPEECVFVDDRALNLECAQKLGMRTIHYQTPGQLHEDLRRNGVELAA
ncbi:MAG: HAD family phosphatase [Acidobacteria bacterium]|nr:HAD family phosphatase [Acidobacteriota bacterium]